jgi:hypothetical protein
MHHSLPSPPSRRSVGILTCHSVQISPLLKSVILILSEIARRAMVTVGRLNPDSSVLHQPTSLNRRSSHGLHVNLHSPVVGWLLA